MTPVGLGKHISLEYIAVKFDAAACTFGEDQGEEVCYSLRWLCGGCTCD